MSYRDLIVSLHTGIQQLQEQYPDRWRVMLDAIIEDPDGDFAKMAKQQTPAAQTARTPSVSEAPTFTPDFSQERLKEIALRAIEGR
ncbi:MAG: hypothetical protein C4288_22640 [Leptolyngbya sp. ERB_1_1]